MTKEQIEIAAKHFAKNFYFNQTDEWKEIFTHEAHIPEIITQVVEIMSQSDMFEGYNKQTFFDEIMEQINKSKDTVQ